MANTVDYGMGQLRYSPNGGYMTDQSLSSWFVKTSISDSNDSYLDVCIGKKNDNNYYFKQGEPYLLHLEIPQDGSYDNTFQIKLIQRPNNVIDAQTKYQLVKYISVPRALKSNNTTSRVILYPVDTNGEPTLETKNTSVKVAIAKTADDNSLEKTDVLYAFQEGVDHYYAWDSKTKKYSLEIGNKNDVILEHTWLTQSDVEVSTVSFDVIFTPRSNSVSYNGILIQMVRMTNIDYDIMFQHESEDYYGRKINEDGFSAQVYKLKNLIRQESGSDGLPNPLTSIGVYSHPNLLMAINGEEIRVGPAGYYELNDFDINSLAIAAKTSNENNEEIEDNFTLDYQYKIEGV